MENREEARVTKQMGWDRLVEQIIDLFSAARAGFVSDFDGTLSPIVPHPDEARPLPTIVETLAQLVRHLTVVAIVTGRRAEDVARRLPVPGIVIVGNHGVEWLEHGQLRIVPEAQPWIPRIAAAAQILRSRLPDLLVEEKVVTVTVHTRGVDSRELRALAQAVVEQVAREHRLVVKPGKEVWELRPPVPLDKGTAVATLVAAYQLQAVVFAGDDVTDLDAMRRLRTMREEGRVRSLLIGVWSTEAPAELAQEADKLVAGVDALDQLLTQVADRLR